MVSDPEVNQGVTSQVDAIPTWLLPLWANWPVVLEGLIIMGVLLFMAARISPVLKAGIQGLTQKMTHLGEQVGNYRQDTMNNLGELHHEISELKQRVSSLEETIQNKPDP